MDSNDVRDRLEAWLRRQLPGSDEVRVEGLEQVALGHSAETTLLTVSRREDGRAWRQDVVLRLRPTPPGLLEPYDLQRQFDILRALAGTPVRAPEALWMEPTGTILGQPFYVMERQPGIVYEQQVPPPTDGRPGHVERMSEQIMDQVAAIHLVDLTATGLDALGDGRGFLGRELDRWAEDMHRWQRGTLPGLERVLAELRAQQPEPCRTTCLVHGDPKPGNFAFVGERLTGVFDWELAAIGDPRADLGWMEVTWRLTPAVRGLGPAHFDDLLARYQALTGLDADHRPWFRAMQTFKMLVIMLIGAMRVDRGVSTDRRMADEAVGIPFITRRALRDLGVDEDIPSGPVTVRDERVDAARAAGRSS